MFSQMREYQQKFNKLDYLKTRTENNKRRKQRVLAYVSDIYNELYYIYKNKYNKLRDALSAENKKIYKITNN